MGRGWSGVASEVKAKGSLAAGNAGRGRNGRAQGQDVAVAVDGTTISPGAAPWYKGLDLHLV